MKELFPSTLAVALSGVAFLCTPASAQVPQLVNDQGRAGVGSAGAAPRDPEAVPEGLAKSDWASIRVAYEAGRHAFQPVEGGWQARNPGQQWTTKFDRRGFVAHPKDGDWTWGLELKGYGFPGAERIMSEVPAVKAEGQRLTYDWDATVQEWFVNDARGLEHGFTVRERPAGAARAPLQFDLAVRGSLAAQVAADGRGVEFRDPAGATVLNYTGLKVWDAEGKVLASRFEAAGEKSVRVLVEEAGARYPLTIDPIAQQAYLKPAAVGTTQRSDNFGSSVAVSRDTVVVGASGEDSSTTGVNKPPNESDIAAGAVYVFVRSAGVWTQQAYLKPAAVGTTQRSDGFGVSVAISRDTVVVGANGEDSSTTGVNSTPNESASFSGAAYVFVRSTGVWRQQAYLKPAAVGTRQADDRFGYSVAVSGDTVVVGAYAEDSSTTGVNSTPNESATESGAAYVFVRSAGVWTQQAYLKPAAVGTSQRSDGFGYSVAVSGDTVVVGARYEDSSTTGVNSAPNESAQDSGAAYVFVRSAGVWTQQAYLKPAAVGTTQEVDNFGISVAVSGDTVVVGALLEDSSTTGVNSAPNESANSSGAAYVFTGLGPVGSDPDRDNDGMPDDWEVANGLNADLPDADGDLDEDSFSNLVEFALGTDPRSGSLTGPIAAIEDGYLTLAVTRNPAASALQFRVEVSGDLANWVSGPAHVTVLEDAPTRLRARDNIPVSSAQRRYIRLEVVRP
ncbi:MAG: FG-GAP repeat protein [Verrucomicrobiales bacterium]